MGELLRNDPIPLDPWGQPLRLLHTEDGIRVYSIGINGRDDRGRSSWADDGPVTDADDPRTRLLNPELRGLPPKKIEPEDFIPDETNSLNGYDDPFTDP